MTNNKTSEVSVMEPRQGFREEVTRLAPLREACGTLFEMDHRSKNLQLE